MITKVFSSLFKRKTEDDKDVPTLTVDMHSHLLPAIDDGVTTYEQAVGILTEFVKLGYKKMVITPHIMGDFYRNTPEIIYDKLDKLRDIVKELQLPIILEAAAEYYLDESFIEKLKTKEPLLCFGEKKYVLFETSYMNSSPYTTQVIFMLQSQGYRPVLAHPERYVYLFENFDTLYTLKEKGCLFQINMSSLIGYYSRPSKMIAERLINEKMVDFIGTDCHNEKHLAAVKDTTATNYFKKALQLNLLNNTL
jgi:tyrosine-protein phosphatase YwqE